MARVELVGGSVSRLVNVWRDSDPMPGEKNPKKLSVDYYTPDPVDPVATFPVVDTPRWQQFLVNPGPVGDELLAALEAGPVVVAPQGDKWVLDLDHLQRPK